MHGLPALTTSVEERCGTVRFVVATADQQTRELLASMGYLPADEERSVTRWFARSPAVYRYYERFAASVEQMVLQKAGRVAVPWETGLLQFLRRVRGTRLSWWLYGSGALAVRGLPIQPRDIDVRVDDAAFAGHLCDDLLVTPVERLDGWVAKYVGRAFCHAIIEWLSEPHTELDDRAAPSEQGVFIEPHLEVVRWRGHDVRVPPLWAQLSVAEQRGLTDRAALIRSAIRP
jgi:hypothetical protein